MSKASFNKTTKKENSKKKMENKRVKKTNLQIL